MQTNKLYIFKDTAYTFPKVKTFKKEEHRQRHSTLASNMKRQIKEKAPLSSLLSKPFIAGLIDGDGFLKVQKFTGEVRIVGHDKCRLFYQLQEQFGGDVRKEKGKQALRYFLNSKNAIGGKPGLISFVSGLNGHIRNTVRVAQFKELCAALNIDYKEAGPITLEDGYLAGFFIADGSVYISASYSAKTKRDSIKSITSEKNITADAEIDNRISKLINGVAPRASIKITNKFLVNLNEIAKLFNSELALSKGKKSDKSDESHYVRISSEQEILRFLSYMNKHRSSSIKHKRLDLLETFFELSRKKAYLPGATAELSKAWHEFAQEWYLDRIL